MFQDPDNLGAKFHKSIVVRMSREFTPGHAGNIDRAETMNGSVQG